MRRWLLIGGTLLVLAVVFAAFLWSQRDARLINAARALSPATRRSATTQIGSIGGAEAAWVTTFDKRTGLRQARFRGEQFVPQQGDQVAVERPQVEFFLGKKRGETVRIEGETGLVIMPGGGPRIRADLSSTAVQTPSRGSMRNVTISYYPSEQAVADKTPELTVKMPNAYFDADLFEIATEGYVDADGRKVEARDVPIVLRGDTFDFDGKGLTIQWDERSQKLKSMVIYHGDQLVLKKPLRQFGRPGEPAGAGLPLAGVQLAAANNGAALQAAAGDSGKTKGIYRATFNDKVVVTQNDKPLATGSVMHVDFLEPESGAEQPAATARSARAPAATSAQPAVAAANGTGATSRDTLGVDQNRPIVVRWSGQMVVKPAPEESLRPESSQDAILRLAGSDSEPARLQSDRGWIEGAWAAYQVTREFAWVEGAPGKPVRMADAKGSVLTTPQLRYARQEGKAVLRGPSTAELVDKYKGQKRTVDASWQELAEATFAGPRGEALSKLLLQGDVKIEHPRLQRFNAGSLVLEFDPASAKSAEDAQIKQITAAGGVDCVVANENREPQAIRAKNLKLFMSRDENGEDYPNRVEADGAVFAGDTSEQIQADAVQADLFASPKGQSVASKAQGFELAGLEHLVAAGNVRVRTAKGETITGDRLQVRQSKDKASWVVLEGRPATVVQEGSSLSATFIEIDTATEKAVLTGGGKLTAADAKLSKTSSKGMPVEVTWTGDGNVDGSKNMAVVQGNVVMRYTDPDGSINEAWGDRVEIGLAQKAEATPQQKKQFAFMSDRVVKQVTLLPAAGGDVKVQSVLPGPAGTILRQVSVFGPRLDCMLSKEGVSEVHVPADAKHPGRLLYIDMPPATRQTATVKDPLRSAQMPGATAFSWTRELTYDRARGQVTMDGDVQVQHNPMLPGAKKFSMSGQKIVADVIAKDQQTVVAGSSGEAVEIRKITLTGSPVRLEREDTELTAPLITIDPAASVVHAIASERDPVQVEKGRMTGVFDVVDMNTRTNEMSFGGARGMGRQ